MTIEFWAQAGFLTPYGSLSIIRTDPGGLVLYSWSVPESRAAEAQTWIRPLMLVSPEPLPVHPPDPVRPPSLAERVAAIESRLGMV